MLAYSNRAGMSTEGSTVSVLHLTFPEMTYVAVFRQLRAPVPVSASPINAFKHRKLKLSARGAGKFKIYT